MSWYTDVSEGDKGETYRRRGYLKTVGAAIGSMGALRMASGSAAAASYETITLGRGERRSFSLNSGDTLENVLIDATASGADVSIRADGDGWAIRNVGIKGRFDVGDATGGIKYVLSVEGNGVVENVYLGDGHEDGVWKGAMISGPDHAGHIDVRNCNVAHWTANAIYAAGSGRRTGPGSTDGRGGDYTFENCYFRNNNIAHLRLAADGTEVLGCTFVNTGDVPGHPNTAGGDSGVVNSRGIYTGYGDPSQVITVRDCNVQITSSNTNGAASAFVSGDHSTYGELSTVDVADSQVRGAVRGDHVELGSNVGSNPDVSVPSGVPTSAEEAASGGGATGGGGGGSDGGADDGRSDDGDSNDGSDDGSDGSANVLSITGQSGVTEYEFTVDSAVEQTTANGATVDAEDSVSGSTATGAVAGGTDSFEFVGDVVAFALDGDASVALNGSSVDPAEYPDDVPEEEPPEEASAHVISISGANSGRVVGYSLSVEGDIEQTTANGATVDAEDSVSGSTATGAVAGGTDSFEFTGELLTLSTDGEADVTLDGEQVDPSDYTDEEEDEPLEDHLVSITTTNRGEVAEYRFTVEGDVEQTTANGATVDAEDSVSGSTATGAVAGGTDSFEFTGELRSFDASADVEVTLDDRTYTYSP